MSKYLTSFQRAKKNFNLIGDCILVEELPKEETKSAGGLILSSTQTNEEAPKLVRVLAINENLDPESGEETLEVKPGDLALVGDMSVKWYGTFAGQVFIDGQRVGLSRESEILLLFNGQEGYDKVSTILRSDTKSA